MIFLINIFGKINLNNYYNFIKKIERYYFKPEEILININSTGSDNLSTPFKLNRYLNNKFKTKGIKIKTFCEEICLNTTCFIYLNGDETYAFKNSLIGNIYTDINFTNASRLLTNNNVDVTNFNDNNLSNILVSNNSNIETKINNNIKYLNNSFDKFIPDNASILKENIITGQKCLENNIITGIKSLDNYISDNHTNTKVVEFKFIDNNEKYYYFIEKNILNFINN